MDVVAVMNMVIPVLLGLLAAAALWAIIEVAMTVRKSRETLRKADALIEKADPLVERATLTLDAVNLEMMRVDGILEDVSKVTDTASDAADAINTVANAPMKAVTGIVDALRFGAKDRMRARKVAEAAKPQAIASSTAVVSADEAVKPEPTPSVSSTGVSSTPVHEAPAPSPKTKSGYTVVAPAVCATPSGGDGTVRLQTVRPSGKDSGSGHVDGESVVSR